jgi:hypothetical protein
MNLPAADRALIQPEKLRDYLLSTEHPVGRFKAAFFWQDGLFQAGLAAASNGHIATRSKPASPWSAK